MLKIAHKDDYNAMLKRCEGASSSVASASIRIMTSLFVALLCPTIMIISAAYHLVFGYMNSALGQPYERDGLVILTCHETFF